MRVNMYSELGKEYQQSPNTLLLTPNQQTKVSILLIPNLKEFTQRSEDFLSESEPSSGLWALNDIPRAMSTLKAKLHPL
jgi:hypothetical protein